MKSLLAIISVFGAAALASAQELSRPLPSVVQSALPASAPMGMTNLPTNWGGSCSDPQSCAAGSPNSGAARGGACARLWSWLTFRVCEPNHQSHVPYPYHAPLRTYFPYTPAPIGANGPLDCNSSRNRFCGRESAGCAPGCTTPATGMVIARPGYEYQSMKPNEGTGERKTLVRRMMSAFAPEGSGSANGGINHPGTGMHYAGSTSPLFRPAVTPAAALLPATATRPFSNP